MPVTALLAAFVLWCLLYGRLAPVPLALLCLAGGAVLAFLGRHEHGGALSIDALAQRSKLSAVNATLKTWGCLALVFCAAFSKLPAAGLVLAAVMLVLTVIIGRLPVHEYLSLLSLPAIFMLLSGLALLFDWSLLPNGVLNLPIAGGYFVVRAAAQARAALVMSRALGAVSCLYLLSLSTPMTEIIAVLRRAHVPNVVVELMYLIYRYIFLMLNMYSTMRDAAESRLGYDGLPRSLRTTGQLYGNLLARSFRRASACFDAMESRCYDGELRFLERAKPIRPLHGVCAGALLLCFFALSCFGR